MSKVRRWAHTVTWEGLQISAAYMAINDGGEYVMHDDYAALEAELAKLRAGQEPVAYITGYHGGRCIIEPVNRAAVLPSGMALYTTPQPSAVPDGWKLVPVERITIALESVQNAMGDAYNNAYQECCGRGQGQCCGDPVAAWSDADTAIMDALAPAQRELSALLAAAPSAPATVQGDASVPDAECRRLLFAFGLECNTIGLLGAAENLHKGMKVASSAAIAAARKGEGE